MFKLTKKKVAGLVVAGSLAVGAPLAWSYWTTTGSGSGDAATTAGVTDELGFVQDPLTAMYPGDSSQDLVVEVTNEATENVYVEFVKAYVEVEDSDGACDATDFLLNGNPAPGSEATAVELTWTAQDLDPAEAHDATGTIQFNNKDSNQDGCKNADVKIHYLAS